MKKLTLLLAAFALVACSSTSEEAKTGKAEVTNDKGVVTAEVTMKGDKIESVKIDEKENGKDKTKKEMKEEYGMKASGASAIGKEWYEQVESLEAYIAKNGVDKVNVGDDGKATNEDVLTGCTIAVSDFVKATQEAVKNAK